MTTRDETCPPENDVAELAMGGLRDARRAEVEAHLDTCAACRAMVAELAESHAENRSPAAASVPSHEASSGEPGTRPGAVLQRGDAFGRYVILSWLGAGAMGSVYRARDTRLQREVALKVLLPGTTGAARAIREARAGAALDHPNVAPVFDFGVIDGTTFIAMELVVGQTLRQRMSEADLPISLRIEWLVAIASALGAAHDRGVVHRDVKPENVMVRDDGIVKVLDFGLAHRRAAESDARLTAKGSALGTPAYMAPEQLRGEEAVAASDQFAWAVTAFELLSGTRPWRIASDEATARGCPPLPESIGPEVHSVIARALAPLASNRFPTMADAASALAAPALPEAITPPVRKARFSISHAIFAAGCLVMLGAAVQSARLPAAPHARVHERTAASKARARSSNADAVEAYRAGLEAQREGSMGEARRFFSKATKLDPAFAAAHLRAAMLSVETDTMMRTHLQDAEQHRSALAAEEQELLNAFLPWRSVPVDWEESIRRLSALAQRHPADPEVWYALGWTRVRSRGSYPAAVDAFRASLEADPDYAAAWAGLVNAFLFLGDETRLSDAIDRCLEVSPIATTCLNARVAFDEVLGRCEDELAIGSRLIALAPRQPRGYQIVANARFALGDAAGAEEALAKKRERLEPESRRAEELGDRMRLAIARGDFLAADQFAIAWTREVSASTDEIDHYWPFVARAALLFEMGRPLQAASLAADYLRAQPAWTADDAFWSTSIYAYDVELRAGAIDTPAFRRLRAFWLKGEAARSSAARTIDRGHWWFPAYADAAISSDLAREALAALPDFEPLQTALNRGLDREEPLGRVYLLAGRTDDALTSLRLAAGSCGALQDPAFWAAATFELGAALHAKGDLAGACDAYARILARWGRAVPRSLTAEAARALRATVGCAP